MTTRTSHPMQARQGSPVFFVVGIILSDLGIFLIGSGSWDALDISNRMAIYSCGAFSVLLGICLIWGDALSARNDRDIPEMTPDGIFLGAFRMNAHEFAAYERIGNDGRTKFRLVSTPVVTPIQEAAYVRYMVNEGLIQSMWPSMGRQIVEDASWAFVE